MTFNFAVYVLENQHFILKFVLQKSLWTYEPWQVGFMLPHIIES